MKLLADVNVSRRVVEALRARGFDATRVPEIMDARTPDHEILAEASRRGAIVLSFDQDFSALLAISGATGPSLINLRVTRVDADELARLIADVLRLVEPDLEAGAVVTIDDTGARVHALPLT